MKLTKQEQMLYTEISKMQIIDCHEHLPTEDQRVKTPVDVFTLFSHYSRVDLIVAGMPGKTADELQNKQVPFDKRWSMFEPYWHKIRHTSYSRSILLAIERFYGYSDITKQTAVKITDKMVKFNKPGIYKKVLRDACNIRTCLNQNEQIDSGTDLLTLVMHMPLAFKTGFANPDELIHPSFNKHVWINTFDDFLDAVAEYIVHVKSKGAAGLKMTATAMNPPDKDAAVETFNKIKSGKLSIPNIEWTMPLKPNPVRDYAIDHAIKVATGLDMAIAVHTGYWGDFRAINPLNMIPVLFRHPNAKFDVYHLGYPWVRETLMLGKQFPNVWLNFCWLNIISQSCTMDAYNEAIDLVPTNKILAFGGDYGLPVENVYGHLVMARENVARVLSSRIKDGLMTVSQAVDTAKQWFCTNPAELYKL
jgi:predicted TIM-barrel fold metal-dependent hydrolase